MEAYLTTAEVAQICRLKVAAVRQRAASGYWPGTVQDERSGRYLIPESGVSRRLRQVEAAPGDPPRTTGMSAEEVRADVELARLLGY